MDNAGNISSGDKRKRALQQRWNSESATSTPEDTLNPMSGYCSNLNFVHKKYMSKTNESTSQINKTLFKDNLSMPDNSTNDAGSYTL